MLIEYLYRKSIGARGGGGGDLHKNLPMAAILCFESVGKRNSFIP